MSDESVVNLADYTTTSATWTAEQLLDKFREDFLDNEDMPEVNRLVILFTLDGPDYDEFHSLASGFKSNFEVVGFLDSMKQSWSPLRSH